MVVRQAMTCPFWLRKPVIPASSDPGATAPVITVNNVKAAKALVGAANIIPVAEVEPIIAPIFSVMTLMM